MCLRMPPFYLSNPASAAAATYDATPQEAAPQHASTAVAGATGRCNWRKEDTATAAAATTGYWTDAASAAEQALQPATASAIGRAVQLMVTALQDAA